MTLALIAFDQNEGWMDRAKPSPLAH